ncbi:MAG: hypothetical protein ABW321_13740 [Polyangiales bacterium]
MTSEIKGLSLLNYSVVLAEARGQVLADQVITRLPSDLQHALSYGEVVASSWYPIGWKCAMHAAAHAVTREDRLAYEMGRAATLRDLRGVYRMFVKIATPRYILSIAGRLLARYLRPCELYIVESDVDYVRVGFRHCHGFTAQMWLDVLGGCHAALELAGARNVRLVVETGAGDGDSEATGVARWQVGAGKTLRP